jgi:hypothetical protein
LRGIPTASAQKLAIVGDTGFGVNEKVIAVARRVSIMIKLFHKLIYTPVGTIVHEDVSDTITKGKGCHNSSNHL